MLCDNFKYPENLDKRLNFALNMPNNNAAITVNAYKLSLNFRETYGFLCEIQVNNSFYSRLIIFLSQQIQQIKIDVLITSKRDIHILDIVKTLPINIDSRRFRLVISSNIF